MPKSLQFIPYARQTIDDEDVEAVVQSLKQGVITRGEKVEEFEKALAQDVGAAYAVAFSSGTTALDAACYAAGVDSFDRVITTPNTFIGTVAGALGRGADLCLCDIDPDSGSIDLADLAKALEMPMSRGRKIVVPVHYAGLPVDMQRLDACLRVPSTVVIEDACHALGASYGDGSKVGSCAWSAMTVFSFHPAKSITTGEGGMVTTNDEDYYRKLQLYRNNCISHIVENSPGPWYYEVADISGNHHMTDFQAALGLSQLGKLAGFIKKRRQVVRWYRKRLGSCAAVRLPDESGDSNSACHLFVVGIDFSGPDRGRAEVMRKLEEARIGTQVHYVPLYRHPAVQRRMRARQDDLPGMEKFYASALSLPLHCGLKEREVEHVCQTLMELLPVIEKCPRRDSNTRPIA